MDKLDGLFVSRRYPKKFPLIKFYHIENSRMFISLTNNFKQKAQEIALLRKNL